ncbi:MAG: hypothetical protein CV087_14755 [Candidatus Brocadia sp. WS118]|nr:MAG: hypothetical protein CV087_14755 [Candidatus Brocadia sp. WS118]
MKNKKVYVSPNVKGVYVLQSILCQNDPSIEDYKKKRELEERESEDKNRTKELTVAQDEACENERVDAENNFEQKLREIKNRYESLVAMFQDAVKHLTDKRERIWQESESEIAKLILAIASKVVGYEVSNNSVNVVRHVIRDALSYVKEKKVIVIRLSADDAKKMNELDDVQITDQSIKFVEDKTISSGGCVIDTNIGSIDSRIETRWEEIIKALSGNNNETTNH